jgi:hypothetical protein
MMDFREDKIWKGLLARSAPTFSGESTPPYGFVTSTLARLRAENSEREQMEKMGKWAVLTSLAALACVLTVTMNLQFKDRGDLDPGMRSIIQIENVQEY